MEAIKIKEGYSYLPDNNLLLNDETLNKFKKYFKENKIVQKKLNVTKEFLIREIKNTEKIFFEVTQGCNLRCSYCVFNDNYLFDRGFTKKSINLKDAKKGLKYLFDLIKDRKKKKIVIGFYGGEPFIEFNLIKEIVNYAKGLFSNWILEFSATTNATLLTKDIVDYITKENFELLISLDGPKENQDAKRVYQSGKGTFDDVINSLKMIKSKDSRYYKNNVTFNIVHSLDLDLSNIYEFFTKNELVNDITIQYNQVASKHSNYYKKIKYNEIKLYEDFKVIVDDIVLKQAEIEKLTPLHLRIQSDYIKDNNLPKTSYNVYDGTCFFNTRMFLDADGKFHMCESINDKFPIGDLKNGLDYSKMINLVSRFTEIKNEFCEKCEVRYLCSPCYLIFADDGTLEIDKQLCKRMKENLIRKLKRRIEFEERIKLSKFSDSKTYKFHQFVEIVDGPVNCAIVNFINGDIYQVPKDIVNQFRNGEFEYIGEFIEDAKYENLIISTSEKTWIPDMRVSQSALENHYIEVKDDILLSFEEGVDLNLLKNKTSDLRINQIKFYGSESELKKVERIFPNIEVVLEKHDFESCSSISMIQEGSLVKTERNLYNYAKICNGCWGHSISVTKDNKIRPCIYSNIEIGSIHQLSEHKFMDKIQKYWYITKDKIEKCKKCELRYFCIDCREKAQAENNGYLYGANPDCHYNTDIGIWKKEKS